MKKWIILGIALILFIALLVWLFIESTKPMPGEKLLQEGRDHLPEGTKLDFQSNPPTSGNHYAAWISKGFYDEPRADGNLVHSLEHGYIIFWYDCEKQETGWLIKPAYAQGLNMTAGSEGSPSAKLSEMPTAFSDGSCDDLKDKIKGMMEKFGQHKLIAVPRIGMDSRIILTAWGRMEKLNIVDEDKMRKFINAFRDNGPEATNEP